MLVWQCPSPRSHMRTARVHQDDAFKDGWVECSLLQMCECVILKKNNNLATPCFPPIPVSNERAFSPFDRYDPLRWMRCRAGVMAADWFWTGWMRWAVGSSTAHLSPPLSPPPLSPLASSPLPLLFFLPSNVPLHVQGQVVWPRETPAERNRETLSEIIIYHPKCVCTKKKTSP